MGAVSAVDSDNVSIKEDSNLDDGVSILSSQNELETSNEVSISETNMVNSQNDNLSDSSSVLSTINSEEGMDLQASNNEADDYNTAVLKSSNNEVATVEAASKVPVKMTVTRASSDDVSSIFRVKLIDGETGKALSGRKINFVINGQNLVGTTDKGGVAKITAKPLAKGDYSVTMSYAGSDYYAATTATQKVTINGVPVKMTVTSAVSDDSNTVFNVKLTDSETGKVLSGYMVNLILNGNNLPARTDENGIAQITTQSLQAGTYSVTLMFSGSLSRYAPTTINQKVSVFKKVPVKMTVTRVSSDDVSSIFRVKLIDGETGKALSGRKINLVINGQNLVGTTDKGGVAKITAKPLAKGDYSVTMSYAGSDYYAATTTTQKVTINGVPVKMTVTSAVSDNSKTIFKVKLTDSEKGTVLSGYMVNLILDGNNLAARTDGNGIAQITADPLIKGTYTVTLAFAGSLSRYAATTVTQKVAVDGFVPVNMTVTSAEATVDSTVFAVKLTDSENGNVLAGRIVNLIVDGKNYAGKTDKNGVAKITTKLLDDGLVDVTLKFSGTISHYAPTTVAKQVFIINKYKTVWINADGGSDEMKNEIANLLRQKGWTVYVSGTGPGYHYDDYFKVTSNYKYYITLYNGFCAGTVREAYSNSIQNTLKNKGVQLVIMWDTSDWTNPQGMAPYRYGDFTGYNAAKAWDDNFSKNDPSINNVGDWLKSNNAFYCANPTAEGLVEQFLAGGYFAYSGK